MSSKNCRQHQDDSILIIGTYINQLNPISEELSLPIVTGSTPTKERVLLKQFRTGKIRCLVVSKIANFAIDLPDANVAIQISGPGSRQEEAQHLGRLLPKRDQRDRLDAINQQSVAQAHNSEPANNENSSVEEASPVKKKRRSLKARLEPDFFEAEVSNAPNQRPYRDITLRSACTGAVDALERTIDAISIHLFRKRPK